MIYGNIEGIRDTYLNQLEALYETRLSRREMLDENLVRVMMDLTDRLNREISIAIDRRGNVKYISVGDSTSVDMPIIDIREKKLSGIRIIHTHPNGISKLSAIDISALLRLKLDCIAAVAEDENKNITISIGFCDIQDGILTSKLIEDKTIEDIINLNIDEKVYEIESMMQKSDIQEDLSERALVVGCDSEESLAELEELADACEVKVVGRVFQKRTKIDTAFYVGTGKVKEIALLSQAIRANTIIFDDELTGSQVRNLEDEVGMKVIDRNTLILDIFARRAKSREAKIQVELAQLKYRLPRLMGLGAVLSRTGGGIGTRGPGEKKLETDRRHIKERLYDLKDELEKIQKNREVQREKRSKDNIPKVSLVGYTNVGKSTLRNVLCDIAIPKEAVIKEKVFEADMLFATLDTTTRALLLSDNRVITLTDTVGFIRKLPHELVEAFKSTLEEVIFSDQLVHVVDVSSTEVREQINAVEEVLRELGAFNIPKIMVLNKIDKAEDDVIDSIKNEYTRKGEYLDVIEVSAKEGKNLDGLLNLISKNLPQKLHKIECIIPYSDSSFAAYLHRNSNIIEENYKDEGIYIKAEVDDEVLNKSKKYSL